MATAPSQRRNFKDADMALNLTPMMNLIALLIPTLLVSTVFVEIVVMDAVAASSNNDALSPPEPEKALDLRVMVTGEGYRLNYRGGDDGSRSSVEIPLVQSAVACDRFIGTVPPPRQRNSEQQPCREGDGERRFWTFDSKELRRALLELHSAQPGEHRMTLTAEENVHYEAVTDVMDAAQTNENARRMFDEVLLSPGAAG